MAEKAHTHRAYATKREGHISWWIEIGVASAHSDGKGFDVHLYTLPVGGFNGHVLVRVTGAIPDEGPGSPGAFGNTEPTVANTPSRSQG